MQQGFGGRTCLEALGAEQELGAGSWGAARGLLRRGCSGCAKRMPGQGVCDARECASSPQGRARGVVGRDMGMGMGMGTGGGEGGTLAMMSYEL